MARYFLDCEFDGLDGPLLSLAIVPESDDAIGAYIVMEDPPGERSPWVAANVVPLLDLPDIGRPRPRCTETNLAAWIEHVLDGDDDPVVIADWPDDFRYLSRAVLTGPGTMIRIPKLTMVVERVDAYPTALEGAVQHNAWWDAMALRHLLTKASP